MKLVRSIAMNTDHDRYAHPTEVTGVALYMDPDVMTPEVLAAAKRLQVERLHSHAKSMPPYYWYDPARRPYADELIVPASTRVNKT